MVNIFDCFVCPPCTNQYKLSNIYITMMEEASVSDEPVFIDVRTSMESPYGSISLLKHALTAPVTEQQEVKNVPAEPSNPCLQIQQRRIRCTECDRYSAETEEKMIRHVRKVHRGENPFQCAMCDYSTYNKAVFEEHVRVHQGIKPFKCSYCSYRSASKKNAKKHELIHRPDNPNRCSQCGFIAKHIRSLQSHQKTHTTELPYEDIPYQCVDCKNICQDDYSLLEHKKRCQKFISRSRRSVTVARIRSGIKKKKLYDFKCCICKWSGNSKPRILLHLIHHPNQDVDEELLDVQVLRGCGIQIGSLGVSG